MARTVPAQRTDLRLFAATSNHRCTLEIRELELLSAISWLTFA